MLHKIKNYLKNTSVKYLSRGKSPWRKSLYVVIGMPRSGLTLLTAILGSHPDLTAWHHPYQTRKHEGIEPFTDFESIQDAYKKVFSDERTQINNFVISASTANQDSVEFVKNSVENLINNNINVQLIWLTRDINHTYFSQREAAHKFWGDEEVNINQESYKNYVGFIRQSYIELAKLALSNRENLTLVSYKQLTNRPEAVIKMIMRLGNLQFKPRQLDYASHINLDQIAGDPGFGQYTTIEKSRQIHRESMHKKAISLQDKIDQKYSDFIKDYTYLNTCAENKMVLSFSEYTQQILEDNFDTLFYLEQNQDVESAKVDPLEHYLNHGWKEDRNPTSSFQARIYRENVLSSNQTIPFVHYLLIGQYLVTTKQPSVASLVEDLKIIDPESYEISDDLMLMAPKFDNPEVSIVIPAYGQQNYTLACIDSILKHTVNVSYEIIVMDDKSPDREAREIGKYMQNIRFYSNVENLGFVRNCNLGASYAAGKYIFFLNNDTNVQPGWLDSLIELMESSEQIGLVGSRLVYPTGEQQDAGGIIWNDASGWNYGRLDDPGKPEFNYVKESDYLTGAAMMIRRSLWEEIGGFDKRYAPAYYEDTDLAFEVRSRGYKTLYQPKSIVVHFEGVSNGTDPGSGIKRYQVVNRENFYEKWKEVLNRDHFPNADGIFLARDRSKNKKHMLFVDHYLPHFDQDAGSKATLQYLQIFAKNNIQIHFIGDNFYDYPGTPYLEALTQMGVEVLHGSWYQKHWKEWFAQNGKYFDYVILSRPHISVKYIDTIRECSDAKVIYYGHDLHFLRERREYEIKKDKGYLQSSKKWEEFELELIKKSDVSYYFSDVEQSVVKENDSTLNVDVVPLYIFESFKDIVYKTSERKDIMFVGGFNHGPNSDAMLWFVNDVWPSVHEKLPNVHFYIIGSNPPQEILEMANEYIAVTGFVSDEELEAYYAKCKLAVVPLRFGAGVKGKVVDAMHNALPMVTTPVGAEGIQNAQEFMNIADDTESFADAISTLYNDNEKLQEFSKKSLEHCKKYFCTSFAKEKMSNIIVEFKE